jgi:hypothetical protein
MTDLSPAARAVWEAFRQFDEAGMHVDYDVKIAAVLRAAAMHLRSEEYAICNGSSYAMMIEVDDLLDLAAELESFAE